MKTYVWTIILLCCCLWCRAQTKYEVTANTFLNIRSYASEEAPVLGTIDKGGKVDVYEITDGWAKIGYDNGYAYASAKYLKKMEEEAPVANPTKRGFHFPSVGMTTGNAEWMVYLIAALSVALFLIRKSRRETPLEDGLYTTNWVLFLTTTLSELIYLKQMGGNAIWFCIPDIVGWLWTIVNFLLFGFVVYNQLICFFNTLEDAAYNSYGSFDKRWGIYSWAGGIIAGIVTGIFFPAAVAFVAIAFIICQIIQIVLIFKGVIPKGGWGNALLCVAIYLLGSLSTVLILAHFVVLLIIVLVACFILYIIGQGSKRSSRECCENCNHYSGGYCNYHNGYVSDAYNKTCSHYS